MLEIGTKVKVKQPALINEFDRMGKRKMRVNDSPLFDATGIVIGQIGEHYYVDLDNKKMFLHNAQNAPRAFTEKELESI